MKSRSRYGLAAKGRPISARIRSISNQTLFSKLRSKRGVSRVLFFDKAS